MNTPSTRIPLSTALYHTEECSPMLTFPTTVAEGATKDPALVGVCLPKTAFRIEGCTVQEKK